jgi:hypothetical protein
MNRHAQVPVSLAGVGLINCGAGKTTSSDDSLNKIQKGDEIGW